jgi:hypothetical protein
MAEHSPRRSLRLQAIKSPNAGTAVFEVPELLVQIVNLCSWASRINISHSSIHARKIVQASVRQRIRDILKPFVSDLSVFFLLLREIKAAIVGSVAWGVMTVDHVRPRDLNIVVPNGSAYGVERLKALLSCSGTTIVSDGSAGIVYEDSASRFVKLMLKSVSLVAPALMD